uniref:Uncharacterized protein n=1 Tax=Nymphaea colorata TaxID=210225 RepID=A0A5K1CR53_9MAGN
MHVRHEVAVVLPSRLSRVVNEARFAPEPAVAVQELLCTARLHIDLRDAGAPWPRLDDRKVGVPCLPPETLPVHLTCLQVHARYETPPPRLAGIDVEPNLR